VLCCGCGDEPSGSFSTELVSYSHETVHMSLVHILVAVFDISHELEGYLLC
jgi:hypothetical protein